MAAYEKKEECITNNRPLSPWQDAHLLILRESMHSQDRRRETPVPGLFIPPWL
jgi:hypothetical protein